MTQTPSRTEPSVWPAIRRRVPPHTGVLLMVLVLTIILVGPSLTPHYSSINAHDEAKYIESGRLLLLGEMRNLVWGPLVAVAYAPFHLVFGGSPNWFLLDAWGGSALLYALMWLSFYTLARQLTDSLSRYAMLGILFITPSLFDVLSNPSDALFVALSTSALATLLAFRRNPSTRKAAIGSALIALAVLARFEGIVLLPMYWAILLILRRRKPWQWNRAAAAILPAVLLLAGAVGLLRLSIGSYDLGIAGKSYESFEMNQPLPNGDVDAQREMTRELFGTREENQGSVLRAVLRNPVAFGQRVLTNVMEMPERFLSIYGKRLAPVFAILSLFGLASLLQRRRWGTLAILAVWSLQPAVSLAFLPLHFLRQLAYMPLVLSAIGVTRMVEDRGRWGPRRVAAAVAFLLAVYGLLDAKLAFTTAGLVLGAALVFVGLLLRSRESSDHSPASAAPTGLALLLAAGLILRAPYRFPDFPEIGTSDRERAVHAMQAAFSPGSRILEPLPLPALAAKLDRYPLADAPTSFASAQRFHDWLHDEDIAGIYVEGDWSGRPDIGDLIASDSQGYFSLVYRSDNGSIRVFAVR
jgi:hypothetical protein